MSLIDNVKLLAYIRERNRIMLLSDLLICKSDLIEGNTTEEMLV